MPPAICSDCTETIPDDYLINTGDAWWCDASDGVTHDLGNVKLLNFQYTPNVIEHRRGKDGAVDALIPVSEDFLLTVTVDRFNPRNVALMFGQDLVSSVSGCEVPLKKRSCGREGSFQFIHDVRCSGGTKTVQIDIWRAAILAQATFSFGETLVEFPLAVRALPCDSTHPDNPYGRILFTGACPAS